MGTNNDNTWIWSCWHSTYHAKILIYRNLDSFLFSPSIWMVRMRRFHSLYFVQVIFIRRFALYGWRFLSYCLPSLHEINKWDFLLFFFFTWTKNEEAFFNQIIKTHQLSYWKNNNNTIDVVVIFLLCI